MTGILEFCGGSRELRQPGQEALTSSLKAELERVKRAARDEDQLANEQIPNGVDGPVAKLRRK